MFSLGRVQGEQGKKGASGVERIDRRSYRFSHFFSMGRRVSGQRTGRGRTWECKEKNLKRKILVKSKQKIRLPEGHWENDVK